jgi:CelD/BcsL family acetyltransferase involved in cellulose biosynthesis
MFAFQPVQADEQADYQNWVDNHPFATLFHSLDWIDFICKETAGRARMYRILRDGHFLGYWPFVQVRKGPFRLLGSPLRGWLTAKMGPLLTEPAPPELIKALKELCRREKISYFETSGGMLPGEVMQSTGFSAMSWETRRLDLTADLEEQWLKLQHNCKKNIKKAIRSGIEIQQIDTNSYDLALYKMVAATFKGKKLAVPFPYRRIQLLKDTIGRGGKLLFLGAFHNGNFVGGHIWGHDQNCAYAFVSANNPEYQDYRVNNLLIWEGIKRFLEMGLTCYDMYGGGQGNKGVDKFKASFGSELQINHHFAISFSYIFSKLLLFYENYYLTWKKYPTYRKISPS